MKKQKRKGIIVSTIIVAILSSIFSSSHQSNNIADSQHPTNPIKQRYKRRIS